MEKLNLDKSNLRKFGITMAVAFLVITLFVFFKNKYVMLPNLIISWVFVALAVSSPFLLKPVYIFWMKLAFCLGWVNTRLILSILFYLILTPIGIILRLTGKDLLDRKIDKDKESYWLKKEQRAFTAADYERQF